MLLWLYGLERYVQKCMQLQLLQISQIYCRNRRIIQKRDTESLSQKSQIFQISQVLQISQIYCRNRRYCKHRRVIQKRDTKSPSQKVQILQILQIYCRNRRYCKNQSYPKERYKIPIPESADIANIADILQKS